MRVIFTVSSAIVYFQISVDIAGLSSRIILDNGVAERIVPTSRGGIIISSSFYLSLFLSLLSPRCGRGESVVLCST